MMRRAMIIALMLVAVLVPLAGIGHASGNANGDQSKLQAP
jgi:hypothetical protein